MDGQFCPSTSDTRNSCKPMYSRGEGGKGRCKDEHRSFRVGCLSRNGVNIEIKKEIDLNYEQHVSLSLNH